MAHYRFRYTSPFLPVLNQVNVFYTPQSAFFEIHFIVILLSRPRSSKWPFSFRFPIKYMCAFVISSRHTTCPSALTLVGLINLITFSEGRKSRSFSPHYFSQPPPQFTSAPSALLEHSRPTSFP